MSCLRPFGSVFARALRTLVVISTVGAVTLNGNVLLIVEDSASIYQRAAQGFLLGFDSADTIETIEADAEGAALDRKLPAIRSSPPKLVIAIGTQAAIAARTKLPGYPILYCLALDPGRHSLTGVNIGGLALEVDVEQQMARIQSALPGVTRIGVIYDEPLSGRIVRAARQYLHTGVKLIARDARNATQAAQAIESLAGNIDAFWLLWDPVIANPANFRRLVEFSLRNKVALISPATPFVEAGALMSVSADYFETGKRTGTLARDIVQGKVQINQVADEGPIGPVLTVNSEVARHLGITIPRDVPAHILSPP
jgi:putative tryptophan/tyrosine transport system substrate-binding protein